MQLLDGLARRICTSLAALCVTSLPLGPARAQTAVARDESSRSPYWSFELSGQLRERFESVNNPVFGLSAPLQNDYFLHRAILSGEIRRAGDLRVRVEIAGALTSDWTGSPPPTQDDRLDVLQVYFEKALSLAGGELALRAGRQELVLGAARLVSVRESPNVRRAFDGLRLLWSRDRTLSATAFFMRPVDPEGGVFDDRSSSDERFWGVHATWQVVEIAGLAFDAYYLGLDRLDSLFAQGEARERRHTVGTRAFGERAGWDWNIEAAWQWGSFGAASIRAWTVSVDAGFEFASLPLSPRIGLKADAISGDQDPDDRELGTFNPLYPKLPYFSEANLATPANLLDLQPSLRLILAERVSASLSWNRLWKHEAADAFYAPLLTPIAGTSGSRSRDIGWQTSALVEWRVTDRVEFATTYVSFEPRSVIRQAGGRSGSFFGAWVRWTF